MTFYKLFCMVYRRTDYYELDRIRSELMYPEYYAEKEKRAKEALMKLMLLKNLCTNLPNYDRW